MSAGAKERSSLPTKKGVGEKQSQQAWGGRSRGTVLGYRIFAWLIRRLGLRAAYLLLIPVSFYYVLFAPSAARASLDYLKRRFPERSWLRRLFMVCRHIYQFGQLIVDRVAAAMGFADFYRFETHNEEKIAAELEKGKGVILLGAHVGNWELAGQVLFRHLKRPINLVMFQAEARHIQGFLDSFQQEGPPVRIIQVGQGLDAMFEMISALNRGEIVCIHGDRTVAGGRAFQARFLGADAWFPIVPYMLAASLEVPLFRVFSVKKSWLTFHFSASEPLYLRYQSRKTKEADTMRWLWEYVAHLEAVLQEHPYQWFNLYPFWGNAPDPPATPPVSSESSTSPTTSVTSPARDLVS